MLRPGSWGGRACPDSPQFFPAKCPPGNVHLTCKPSQHSPCHPVVPRSPGSCMLLWALGQVRQDGQNPCLLPFYLGMGKWLRGRWPQQSCLAQLLPFWRRLSVCGSDSTKPRARPLRHLRAVVRQGRVAPTQHHRQTGERRVTSTAVRWESSTHPATRSDRGEWYLPSTVVTQGRAAPTQHRGQVPPALDFVETVSRRDHPDGVYQGPSTQLSSIHQQQDLGGGIGGMEVTLLSLFL